MAEINYNLLYRKLYKKSPGKMDPLTVKYYVEIRTTAYNPIMKPIRQDNHIGLEIECYTKLRANEIKALIFEYDLEAQVQVGTDGSIRRPIGYNAFELRVLMTEATMPDIMKKLKKLMTEGKFKVNNSCGLHVHLDMRNRNASKCYEKLTKVQKTLFGLVNKSRWNNEYCLFTKNKKERYSAINYVAYKELKTIEVRLHQGTANAQKMTAWINLLIKIVNSDNLKEVNQVADFHSWGLDTKTLNYVRKTYNAEAMNLIEHKPKNNEDDFQW